MRLTEQLALRTEMLAEARDIIASDRGLAAQTYSLIRESMRMIAEFQRTLEIASRSWRDIEVWRRMIGMVLHRETVTCLVWTPQPAPSLV